MAQDMGQLTDMWMLNPSMFDPTQKSNQFSNYNNAALPWPPTYNTGAGGPVNAATGQPIQSFLDWQKANPGGMSINATPTQPQAQFASPGSPQGGMSPLQQQQLAALTQANANASFAAANPASYNRGDLGNAGPPQQASPYQTGILSPYGQQQAAPAPQPQPTWQQPNNWQAAINALANPGKVQTMGANVPQVTGYQPAGGVNQAFLNQAGAGQGMNQNFLSALRSIQGRPQQ